MCDKLEHHRECGGSGRRNFLKATGAATALSFVGGALFAGSARGDALTKAQRDDMTPERIIEVMRKGNERFQKGERKDRNYLREQRASAKGQYPAAVLLTCIDSRAPAEVIMDLGIGDIFNCRVAGNIENADILGSMEFACKVAGAKVIMVLGHKHCGAVKGAIDDVKLGNLTALHGNLLTLFSQCVRPSNQRIEFLFDALNRLHRAIDVHGDGDHRPRNDEERYGDDPRDDDEPEERIVRVHYIDFSGV